MPLSWSDLARRTWREVIDDDVLGLAAQLSYYFFLALFPAILCVIALASFLPLHNFTDEIVSSLDLAPARVGKPVKEHGGAFLD